MGDFFGFPAVFLKYGLYFSKAPNRFFCAYLARSRSPEVGLLVLYNNVHLFHHKGLDWVGQFCKKWSKGNSPGQTNKPLQRFLQLMAAALLELTLPPV